MQNYVIVIATPLRHFEWGLCKHRYYTYIGLATRLSWIAHPWSSKSVVSRENEPMNEIWDFHIWLVTLFESQIFYDYRCAIRDTNLSSILVMVTWVLRAGLRVCCLGYVWYDRKTARIWSALSFPVLLFRYLQEGSRLCEVRMFEVPPHL